MVVYIQTEPPIDPSSLTCWCQWLAEDGIEELLAATTTATNCHDSKPLLSLLDKADIQAGVRFHADKAYSSQKPRDVLKARCIKYGLQDKAAKNKPLSKSKRQLQGIV